MSKAKIKELENFSYEERKNILISQIMLEFPLDFLEKEYVPSKRNCGRFDNLVAGYAAFLGVSKKEFRFWCYGKEPVYSKRQRVQRTTIPKEEKISKLRKEIKKTFKKRPTTKHSLYGSFYGKCALLGISFKEELDSAFGEIKIKRESFDEIMNFARKSFKEKPRSDSKVYLGFSRRCRKNGFNSSDFWEILFPKSYFKKDCKNEEELINLAKEMFGNTRPNKYHEFYKKFHWQCKKLSLTPSKIFEFCNFEKDFVKEKREKTYGDFSNIAEKLFS